VVGRWIVPSAAAGTSESCVELRFRERADARRKNVADANADRRVHAGVFGDPRGEKAGKYEVIEALADVMLYRGIPETFVRTTAPNSWPKNCGSGWQRWARDAVHRTRKSWENGYCESFNGKLRDECLNGEIFYSLREAQVVIEKWRVVYNTLRPHSALGYRPPAPVTLAPQMAALRSPTAPCEPPFAPLPDEVVM